MKKKQNERVEPYIKLEHYMMDTAAWTSLSYKAVWLYLELRKQFKFSAGGDNHLLLPFTKIKWKMSKGSFCSGMRELVDKGFIKIVEQGGLFRRPTIYALSGEWKDYSRKIVDKEGREAIRLGLIRKERSWNRLENLKGKRTWEKKTCTPGNI
jgi:hypothetical protein